MGVQHIMETNVSFREINVENPQTAPKTASLLFFVGEWLQYTTGKLAALTPATPVVGLNLTPVPASSTTTDLITFDGINSTEDRFVCPVVNTITVGLITGVFVVGELVIGGTSGAIGKIVSLAPGIVRVQAISGTFVALETITGQTSGATAPVIGTTSLASTDIGRLVDVASDSTSMDVFTIGSGTQFKITKIISQTLVEVAVILLSL